MGEPLFLLDGSAAAAHDLVLREAVVIGPERTNCRTRLSRSESSWTFEARHTALLNELELLDRTLDRLDLLPDDLALAQISDLQGLGAPIRDPRLKGPAPATLA